MHQIVAKADDLVRNQTAHILNPDKPFNLQMPEEGTLFVANLFPALIQRHISRLNAQLTSDESQLCEFVSLQSQAGRSLLHFMTYLLRQVELCALATRSSIGVREMEATLCTLLALAADSQSNDVLLPEEKRCSPTCVARA